MQNNTYKPWYFVSVVCHVVTMVLCNAILVCNIQVYVVSYVLSSDVALYNENYIIIIMYFLLVGDGMKRNDR